jgi:putative redox protein
MVAVQAGPHRFGADEPESVPGGTDTGPDPYGLLLGSLGACTVMTVRLYADRKGWPLEGARVRLRHKRIHADDSGELARDRKGPLIDQIQVELWLDGPLDPAQRQRLVEIAHRCPVHKTMTTETRIHIEAPEAPAQDG